jgi:type II secretory pathway pseudopilin PulG
MPNIDPFRRQDGVTLLGLLILVAILGVVAAAATNVGAIVQRRQAEQELLWVGNAYRDALVRYYNAPSAVASRYPRTLTDLLRDPRQPTPQRYLRQLYADPITGKNDWVLVAAPDGGIACLHSSSTAKPIKIGQFPAALVSFRDAKTYADWLFCVNVGPLTRGQ